MRAGRKKAIIRIASYTLLAGGLYFLILGARELIVPWMHQRTTKLPPPPPPRAPEPGRPPAPPRLDPKLFHPGDTVARLSIPRLDGIWSVVEGTEKNDLRLGPGHLTGTAFPGEKGHCIIAGHRDTQFRSLKDIRKGDEILMKTSIGEYRYRVTGTLIVKPTNTETLADTAEGTLSLITCYPFYYVGNAPKRFIVRAELMPAVTASASAAAAP